MNNHRIAEIKKGYFVVKSHDLYSGKSLIFIGDCDDISKDIALKKVEAEKERIDIYNESVHYEDSIQYDVIYLIEHDYLINDESKICIIGELEDSDLFG